MIGRDWYDGLREELTAEIRMCVNRKRLAGEKQWGDARIRRIKQERIVEPLFPILGSDDERHGRSIKLHNEMVNDKIARQELGLPLFGNEYSPKDEESFEGTPLSDSERVFIGRILALRDAHLPKNKTTSLTSD